MNAFSNAEQHGTGKHSESANDRFHSFLDEHRRLIEIAIRAHSAIATGQAGISGATSNLLIYSLRRMRSHAKSAEAELAQRANSVDVATGP